MPCWANWFILLAAVLVLLAPNRVHLFPIVAALFATAVLTLCLGGHRSQFKI